MKKKIMILVVLAVILCLALANCAGDDLSESAGNTGSQESPAVSGGGGPEDTPGAETADIVSGGTTLSNTPAASTGPAASAAPTASAGPAVSAAPTASPEPAGPRQVKVVLDAGHGGIDPGCEFNGVSEKSITLAIVLMLKEKLEASGISVALTRSGDQEVDLDERWMFANGSGADLFVSIHCNSYDDDTVKGFEGYYYRDSEDKQLAELIFSAAQNYPSIRTRSVREENYRVLRNTVMPAALLEIGYLSNAEERANLQSGEYQNTIAQAVFDGITAMLSQ